MIHQHVKAASSANYSCLFIGQHRTGCWWSRTPKAFAAARLRIGPRRSGGRCINASAGPNLASCCPMGSSSTGRSMKNRGTIRRSGAPA
jgi:hypothetical protein